VQLARVLHQDFEATVTLHSEDISLVTSFIKKSFTDISYGIGWMYHPWSVCDPLEIRILAKGMICRIQCKEKGFHKKG
jgi:hypothetical protein